MNGEKVNFWHFFEEKVPYQALKKAKNKGGFLFRTSFFLFFVCSFVVRLGAGPKYPGSACFFPPSGGDLAIF